MSIGFLKFMDCENFMAKLIILCGLPGSGKSQYAEGLMDLAVMYGNEEMVIHSSDAIRGELFGDPNSQEDNGKVFDLLHTRVKSDLRDGKTVIYDATNITRKARRIAINLIDPMRDEVEVHVIWAPVETCIQRDAQRDRTVGPEVIDKMLRRWQSPDAHTEGFDAIYLVNTDDTFNQVEYVSRQTAQMHIPHDNPHHTLGVYDHCLQTCLNLVNSGEVISDELRAAAYWHDIGKPYTKFYKKNKETGEIDYSKAHFYDHQNVGAYLAYGLFINRPILTQPQTELACKVSWLINVHMDPFLNTKFYKELPTAEKHWIDLLHKADVETH